MANKPPELNLQNVGLEWQLPVSAEYVAHRMAGIEFQLIEQNRILEELLRVFKASSGQK